MEKISEGAEAEILRCSFLGRPAIAKRRARKEYRTASLDNYLRSHRTRMEANIMARLSGKIRLPVLFAVSSDTIYMEYLGGRRLSAAKPGKWAALHLEQAGRYLAVMHNGGVAHGDFTPANLMAYGKMVCVIDFGLSYFTNSIEDKAVDLLLMKRSVSKEAFAGFMRGYESLSSGSRAIRAKLSEIELRGRYQSRTIGVAGQA